MTSTIKFRQEELPTVRLTFDWAEGVLVVPRWDHLPYSVIQSAAEQSGSLSDFEPYLDDVAYAFLLALPTEKYVTVLSEWVTVSMEAAVAEGGLTAQMLLSSGFQGSEQKMDDDTLEALFNSLIGENESEEK